MTRYPPIGQCIYCGAEENLTDEHIIPEALNGYLLLPKSSCRRCAVITSRLELAVARTMYGDLRAKLGIKRKNGKKWPSHLPIMKGEDDSSVAPSVIPRDLYPTVYIAVHFPPPGILRGAELSNRNPPMRIEVKGNPEEMKVAAEVAGSKYVGPRPTEFAWGAFMRVLAKIGHAYAVAVVGRHGYVPLLPDVILGRNEFLSHVVGCADENCPESANFHDVTLAAVPVGTRDLLLTAYIRLLGPGRLPLYQVIVGQIEGNEQFERMKTRVALLKKD